MPENERKDLVVSNQKFNISEIIKKIMQARNYSKFKKTIINDAIKYLTCNPKRIKYWAKMSDDDKIKFIMEYTTGKNIFDHSEHRKYNTATNEEDRIYCEKLFDALISDLWKNSNYNVQSKTFENYQNIINDIVININSYIVDRNWRFTNPKLQQEIILKIINMQTSYMNIDNNNLEGVTYAWKNGTTYMTESQKNECKCEDIISKLNCMNAESLFEIYGTVENFMQKYANEEQLREFIGELPDEVRKEKIYNSVEYSLRDPELFRKKWDMLSYEEKLSEFKKIFSKYTKEYSSRSETINDKDRSVIDTVYPKFFSVQNEKNCFFKESYLNFNPKVLKNIFKDINSEDLDKLIYGIMQGKKNSPITLYCIWDALDKKSQIKYYDKVMEILKDKPECKLEIWNSSKVDSNNKRKNIQIFLSQIQTEDDIKKYERTIREMVRGKKNIKKMGHKTIHER